MQLVEEDEGKQLVEEKLRRIGNENGKMKQDMEKEKVVGRKILISGSERCETKQKTQRSNNI